MKLEINLNDTVEVVLSKFGAKIYNDWWNDPDFNWRTTELSAKKTGDKLRAQLWHLMQVFGPHIHLGGNAPFELCSIVIEKDIS